MTPMNLGPLYESMVILVININQEAKIYDFYPSGLLEAISKLGGLVAILNVGVLLNILHKRWFYKEMNEYFSQSKINPVNKD